MATKKANKQRATKEVTGKRPSRKPPVKKTPVKKTPVKKTTAKKTPVKKTTAKNKPAKKTAPKKKSASKTAPKKKAAKKALVQKKSANGDTTKKKPAGKTQVTPKRAKKAARKAAARPISQQSEQHRGGALQEAVEDVAVVQDVAVAQDFAVDEQQRPAAESISAVQGPPSRQTPAPLSAVSRTATTDNKPVIFLAFANDRDDTIGYLRNLPDEARRLRDVLEPAEQAGLCEVVVRSNSTAGDIFKVFQDPRYRNRVAILHYGGHANGYELLLESAAGQAAAADAGGLAKFLGQQQGLQLVFLNGCSTQQQTQGLLDANISVVISTSRAIEDQVATDFSYQFYQGLAGGATIRTSYNEAEASVQTSQGGNTRGLYFGNKDDSQSRLETDRWPWNLYLREGSESADQWNLPEAVDDPLFGLPSLSEQDLPERPYRHLNWFTRKDAEVFFGRGHQIRELYDRLTAPRTAPILLFYGQSGVGKSSILDAGLIPRLEQDCEVRYLRRTAGGLLDTLQLAFLPEASDAPIETAWRVKEEQTGKPLIVFLDQVEELYTRPVADLPNELEQLLEVVKATFVQSTQRPRGKLVLGFRKEWLAEVEDHLVAYELPRTKVFLGPLDRRGIIEIVRGPARSERLRERYGLTVEDGLPEIIAEDLLSDRDSAIAPTLQILLTKLWTKATDANYEHPHFSQELYQQLKHDGILLRDFLNQQIATFRERYPEAVDSGLLLDIVALHTTPLGTADQRTVEQLQQQYAHLGVTLPELIQQCQDLHLLTVAASAQKDSAKTTRLAHDTLAPLVREQFDVSDKPGQRARRILDNRSVDWEADGAGTPLDEADLKMVEEGAAGTRDLSATEQRLVEASRELRARLKRLRTLLKTAGAVAVAVIAVTAGIALWQWHQAERARNVATERFFETRRTIDAYSTEVADILQDRPGVQLIRAKLLQRAAEDYRQFASQQSDDSGVQGESARAFVRLGDLYTELSQWEDAEKSYRNSISRFTSLLRTSDNAGYQMQLATSQSKLAEMLTKAERKGEAQLEFDSAIDSLHKLVELHPEEDNYREAKAQALLGRATLLKATGDSPAANDVLAEAIKDFEQLVGKQDDPRYRTGLARAWHLRAQVLTNLDQSEEALVLLDKATGVRKQLLEDDPDEYTHLDALAAVGMDRANCLQELGRVPEAEQEFLQSFTAYERLAYDRGGWIERYDDAQARMLTNFAKLLHSQGRNGEAMPCLHEAVRLFRKLAEEFPGNRSYIEFLAVAQDTLAGVYDDLEQDAAATFESDSAEQQRRNAITLFTGLLNEDPQKPIYRERRGASRVGLGRVLHQLGQGGAEGFCQEAIKSHEDAIEDFTDVILVDDNPFCQDLLAWNYTYLGDLYYDLNRLQEAKNAYRQAVAIRGKHGGTPSHLKNYALLLLHCKDAEFRNPQKAIELCKEITEKALENAEYCSLLGAAHFRAAVDADSGVTQELDESIEILNAAVELRKPYQDSMDGFYLAMAYWHKGDKETAQKNYDSALQVMRQNRPGNVLRIQLREEAAEMLGIAEPPAASGQPPEADEAKETTTRE